MTGIISAAEVLRMTMPPTGHVEVREKTDGTWSVSYSDPGFIPCPPVCHLRHKHDYEQGQIETHYKPTSYADALDWADKIAEGREVKIVPFVPLHERKKQKADLQAAA